MTFTHRLSVSIVALAALSFTLHSAEEKKKKPSDEPEAIAKGFSIRYFATPPDVDYPASLAVTPQGVVFAGEDPYNVRANKSGTGRIKRYVDSNGSGKADKVTIFAENVSGPRGMCYVDGTLYVVGAPFLTAYKDDGSGKATSSDVLIEGYGFTPEKLAPDHSEGGVRMAIDGWLYLAVGDQGFFRAVGKDKSEFQLHGGGICRIRPDGSEFELFLHGTRNTYDISIDPLLNGYSRDNTNDGRKWNTRFAHMIYGAEYGYPSLFVNYADEILPCLADWGGGGATGSLFVQEPYMPEGFGNTLLTCDWGRGRIYSHTLTPDGATFKVAQAEFYKGTRPTDLDVDGRGRIFISDWRGATYGRERDTKKPIGYIAVMQNEKGINPAEFPDLDKASDANLIDFIARESQVLRLNSQRVLLRRPFKQENADALLAAIGAKSPLYARVAALFTYKQMLGTKSTPKIIELLADAEMREFALRALADRKTQLEGLTPQVFIPHLKDENPRVRLQAEIALMRLNQPSAAPALVPLLTDKDVEVSHIAMRALRSFNAIGVCLENAASASPETAAAALKTLREMHDEKTVKGLLDLAAKTTDETRANLVRETLARLYFREAPWDAKWWGIPPDTRGPHFRVEKWEQSGVIARFLDEQAAKGTETVQGVVYKAVARYRIPVSELPAIQARLSDANAPLTPELAEIVVQLEALKLNHALLLQRVALEGKNSPKLRGDAIEALARVTISATDAKQLEEKQKTVRAVVDGLREMKNLPKEIAQSLGKLVSEMNSKEEKAEDLARWSQSLVQSLRQASMEQLLKKKDDPAEKTALAEAWAKAGNQEALLNAFDKQHIGGYSEKVVPLIADKNAGVAKAAMRASGSVSDDSALEVLFDSAEQKRHLADALSAIDKIKLDKLDPVRLGKLADRAVAILEAQADNKDSNIVSTARGIADHFLGEKKLAPAIASELAARLKKTGVVSEPLVGDFEPSSATFSATGDPHYKELQQKMQEIPGDKENGKEMFVSLSCNKCHTLSPKEAPRGPMLSDVGARIKRPELIESIILPSEKIVMGYEPKMVVVDGEHLTGFITNDSGDQFVLHLPTGDTKTIQKKQVTKIGEMKLSIMPTGLVSKLTHKQFANLLAYLESLQKPE